MTREEAWNRIDAIIARHEIDDYYVTITSLIDYDALRMARKALEQEPKTGEWQQDLDGTYLCSECGSGFKEQPTFMGKPMFLWCPLCGCRMESEDNE